MILSDHEIRLAIENGELLIDPLPQRPQYSSSALDLFLGEPFQVWDTEGIDRITDMGLSNNLDPSKLVHFQALSSQYLIPAPTDAEGCFVLQPWGFVLGVTREQVGLPRESRIAARVEGRSTLARIGLMVHVTAPTIHVGWSGKIALEMLNIGPWPLTLRPNELPICQLIFERVGESAPNGPASQFQGQVSPGGS